MPDFFVFSKILPVLLYPLPFLLIVVFVSSFWIKKNAMRWPIRIVVAFLWLLSTPWMANLASQTWETPRVSRDQLPAVSDVAVVLGGLSDPTVSNPEHLEWSRSAERLTEAVALYREGRVKALLITSGSGDLLNQEDKEAPGLAAWALSMGVAEKDLVVESASRNTRENATLSLSLAQARGFQSFVLVTSAFHMPRSAAIFRKAGYDQDGRSLILWPVDTQADARKFPLNLVPDPFSLGTVQAVMREMLGYTVYALQGYL